MALSRICGFKGFTQMGVSKEGTANLTFITQRSHIAICAFSSRVKRKKGGELTEFTQVFLDKKIRQL